MKRKPGFPYVVLAAVLFVTSVEVLVGGQAAPPKPVQPSAKDRCPVCGMFVAKHKDFLGEIILRDGTPFVFDGAKDMFRFYFDMGSYAPGKTTADIAAIFVTDYYRLKLVDGPTAFYVIGSNVLGPMGKELIPFSGEKEARTFLADHKGTAVVKFADITLAMIKDLD